MVDGFKFRHKYKYKRLHKDFRNTAFLSYLSSMHQNQFMGLADLCDVALSVSKVIIYIPLSTSVYASESVHVSWLAGCSVPHCISWAILPFCQHTHSHTHTYKQTRTRARAVCTQAHTHTSLWRFWVRWLYNFRYYNSDDEVEFKPSIKDRIKNYGNKDRQGMGTSWMGNWWRVLFNMLLPIFLFNTQVHAYLKIVQSPETRYQRGALPRNRKTAVVSCHLQEINTQLKSPRTETVRHECRTTSTIRLSTSYGSMTGVQACSSRCYCFICH